MNPELPRQISKNNHISNSITFRPVGAELFHVNGRTDGHDEANSRLSQLCEKIKNNSTPASNNVPFQARICFW